MSDHDPSGPRPPRQFVPAPLRAGEGGVRGKDVAAGMGIGCGLSFSIYLGMMMIVGGMVRTEVAGKVAMVAAPVLALGAYCAAIWWAVKNRRKGWAIGMAIFAAVSVLLLFACAALLSSIH